MEKTETQIKNLFKDWSNRSADKTQRLPGSGSDRVYFRLIYDDKSVIAAFNENVNENRAFFSMTKHFKQKNLPVPDLLHVSDNEQYYLLQDLGDISLFDILAKTRNGNEIPESVLNLYVSALESLAYMQTIAADDFDYSVCYPVSKFDRKAIEWDLNYFKYYYAKLSGVEFDELALDADFSALIDILLKAPSNYFLFRDFQSRNIMVHEGKPYFIDYQGGRKGALQYDLVSLLWQARADLPHKVRDFLLEQYLKALSRYIEFNEADFRYYYDAYILIRVLQTLGAYGFRGIYEQKTHFLLSLPMAIKNLETVIQSNRFIGKFPELSKLLVTLLTPRFQPWLSQKTEPGKLVIQVGSFSYKKGLPKDYSGHGGGHIFDCRAIYNPGRYDEYKSLTGRDDEVIEFLDKTDSMQAFLKSVTDIVEQSTETYLQRRFDYLSIQFGCTGGQHRSVYAAEKIYHHLKNKYAVHLVLNHREQDF
ncbi:MAG: phosphotransferase [Bacteroidales bacterium]|jgi:aminoglycoside/choline kinase family phosphotransferase|nr:phosphotransferase [Bacteroidales bacterium]